MTNHDYDQRSCYCTDFAIGYLGIVNEALVFSNKNEIEILPALFESGFRSVYKELHADHETEAADNK